MRIIDEISDKAKTLKLWDKVEANGGKIQSHLELPITV